ncbi:MAG: hypothetical protein J6P74_09120 [Paludibacteraceae bacterium]|nr:hypothetical protein [Paludibacteraceae bacterium]
MVYLYLGNNPDASQATYLIPFYVDGVCGQSAIALTLLFLISLKFKYCAWHRILLLGSLATMATAFLDFFHVISSESLDILTIHISIACIACCVATIVHLYHTRQGHRTCFSRHRMSPRFDSFLIGFIKWFPFIQLFCFLLSNTAAMLDLDMRMCNVLDAAAGNSLLATFFLLCLSMRLSFPYWHRLLIIANFANLVIAFCDANICTLPVSDWQLYMLYIIAPCMCILIILFNQIRTYLHEHQTQTPA